MSNKAAFTGDADSRAIAIFCRPEDVSSFEDAFNRLGRLAAVIKPGDVQGALAWCAEHYSPAVLAVDISRIAHPIARLAELGAVVGPGCRLIALGDRQDVDLYRKLLQIGVFDYLVTPLQLAQLSDVLSRVDEDVWLGHPQPGSVRAGQTVAVVGATGGVGASTLVTSLGMQLVNTHKMPSILVDYDRRASNLALMLGLEANSGLAGILAAPEIDMQLIQRALLAQDNRNGAQRLHLLAQRPGVETPVDSDLLLRLGIALCELYSMSIWDIPSHRPSGSDDLLYNADIRIIMTDYTLQNARATSLLLAEFGDESRGQRLYLIANDARHRDKPAVSKDQFEEFLGRKIDYELPHAGNVLDKSLLNGRFDYTKAGAFHESVARVTCGILGNPSPGECPRGLFKRLRRTIRRR